VLAIGESDRIVECRRHQFDFFGVINRSWRSHFEALTKSELTINLQMLKMGLPRTFNFNGS
jgi:hypothetical protein